MAKALQTIWPFRMDNKGEGLRHDGGEVRNWRKRELTMGKLPEWLSLILTQITFPLFNDLKQTCTDTHTEAFTELIPAVHSAGRDYERIV